MSLIATLFAKSCAVCASAYGIATKRQSNQRAFGHVGQACLIGYSQLEVQPLIK